jgi:hypothetical protein
MIEIRNACSTIVRKPAETNDLQERGINGRISLNLVQGCGMDSSGSGYRTAAGPCDYGNKPFRLRKRGRIT